jgi:hypothetical protein
MTRVTIPGSGVTASSPGGGHLRSPRYVQYFGGYGLRLGDLRHSALGLQDPPGPEYGHTDGIEITTGPSARDHPSAVGVRLRIPLRGGACSTRTPLRAPARSTTTSMQLPETGTCRRA